jgi:anti-sigma regulatory factor (Ser/Thr protein kinase)
VSRIDHDRGIARRLAARAARLPERSFEQLLDVVGDAVVAVDESGHVMFANAAAGLLLQRDPADLVGQEFCGSFHTGGPGHVCPAEECRRTRTAYRGRDTLRRADGTTVDVEASCTPLVEDSELVAVGVTLSELLPGLVDHAGEMLRLTAREMEQREVVQQLQAAVQPVAPRLAGVDLGVFYLAADPSQPTGGDLYDWCPLPDGDLHVAVVDVLGHGVSATKDALAVVHALRVLALDGCPMATLVARADRLLVEANPTLVATVLVARYSPSTGRMVLAGGGHPPMLLVSPGGDVREIEAGGIPIGWPDAGSFELAEVELARSETAIFYTDGLVEARRDFLAGLQELKYAASQTAGYPLRDLPRVLVERALAGAERRDDTLALALRRRAAPVATSRTAPLGPLEHRFTPSLAALSVARHFFDDWLRHQGVEESEAGDLLVVMSELGTNAVRMASGGERSITMRARIEGDGVVLEVEDDGPGLTLSPRVDDVPLAEREDGRGLFLAQALSDEIESIPGSDGQGTIVRCIWHAIVPRREP